MLHPSLQRHVDWASKYASSVLRVFDISHASVEEAQTYSEHELLISLLVECDADVDLDLELEGIDRDSGIRRSAWQTLSTTSTTKTIARLTVSEQERGRSLPAGDLEQPRRRIDPDHPGAAGAARSTTTRAAGWSRAAVSL